MRSERASNAMTVDVEEWFQVSAFDAAIERSRWADLPSRVTASTDALLDLFDEHDVRATFFVLGWIAERFPDLVRRIADRGHEIGCHGYDHRMLHDLERDVLARDTAKSRRLLQDLTGQPIDGYRAASFSIGRRNLWALDVLVDAGFSYDSSLFPVVHDRYGIPGAPRHAYRVRTPAGGSLIEIPPSTVRIAGLTLPVAGGGYLRLLPLALTRWAIRRLNDGEREPAIVYLHPWEVDPGQPRVSIGFLGGLRHYAGLRTMMDKLATLLGNHDFGPLRRIVDGFQAAELSSPREAVRVG